jgi:hypothetical protein
MPDKFWQLLTRDAPTASGANFQPDNVPQHDWHAARNQSEPRCGADQWRTRDRETIIYMHEMCDRHLGHCIRFASTKTQHASRLAGLLAERANREGKHNV